MREDQARAGIKEGKIIVWEKEKLTTAFWFIYLTEHAHDPSLAALIETMRDIWSPPIKENHKSTVLVD